MSNNIYYISNTREDVKEWERFKNEFDFHDLVVNTYYGQEHNSSMVRYEMYRNMNSYVNGFNIIVSS